MMSVLGRNGFGFIFLSGMPDRQSRAQGASRIARRGLNPESLKNAFAQQSAIGHAIERQATRHAQVLFDRSFPRVPRQAQDDFFRYHLNRSRHVHVTLRDRFLRASRRSPKQLVKASVGHGRPAEEIEVIQIQPKRTVRLQVQ